MKIKTFKSGAYACMEKTFPSGMFTVKAVGANGDILDKMRCDDSKMANEYYRAFQKIAKAH